MILRSAEQGLKVPQIGLMTRESEATVLRWLKRYGAEGLEGLQDAPRPGRSWPLTETSKAELLAAVRRRPRSLGRPFSRWTLQRAGEALAEQTGIRVSDATVRRALKQAGMVLSRQCMDLALAAVRFPRHRGVELRTLLPPVARHHAALPHGSRKLH